MISQSSLNIRLYELEEKFAKLTDIISTFQQITEKERNLIVKLLTSETATRELVGELKETSEKILSFEIENDFEEFLRDINIMKKKISDIQYKIEKQTDIIQIFQNKITSIDGRLSKIEKILHGEN